MTVYRRLNILKVMTRRAGINSNLLFSSESNTAAALIGVPLDPCRSMTFDNSNASMFNIDKPLLDFLTYLSYAIKFEVR